MTDDPSREHEDALVERFGIDDPPEHSRFLEGVYGIDRPNDWLADPLAVTQPEKDEPK